MESAYATSYIVINTNFDRISYRFRDIDAFLENSLFSHPPLIWRPLRRKALRYQRLYIAEKYI